MAEELSLNTYPTEPETVSIDTGVAAPRPVSPEQAAPRAFKASFGLGKDFGMSYDDIYNHIISGDEQALRQQAATEINNQNENYKFQVIKSIAQRKGANLSNADLQYLNYQLTGITKPVSPDTVFEEKFFKKYLDMMSNTGETNTASSMYEANREIPKQVDELKGYAVDALVKHQFALDKAQEAQTALSRQGWPGYLKDLGLSLIPGVSEYALRGNVSGVSFFYGGRGSNLREQAEALARLPLDEYKKQLTKILDTLNPQERVEFAHAMAGLTVGEEGLSNVFTAVDISAAKPLLSGKLALGVARKLGLLNEAKQSARAMIDSVTKGGAETKALILETSGDMQGAAIAKFTSDTVKEITGKATPLTEMIEAVPSVLNIMEKNMGSHSRETVNRLKEVTQRDSFNLYDAVSNIIKIEGDPALAVESVAQAAMNEVKKTFEGHSILDVGTKIEYKPDLNIWKYNLDVGKPGGELFFSKQVAENYAKVSGFAGYRVVPADNKANGFVIRFDKSLNQSQSVIKDGAAQAPKNEAPTGILNSLLGKWRTPEETLSEANRENRKVAVYGVSVLEKIATEMGEDLSKLTRGASIPFSPMKSRWEDFKRVLNASAKSTDPVDGEKGWFFQHPAQLDEFYRQTIGRAPDEKEVLAYFSYKRLLEMRRYLENRQVYVNKSKLGTETHTITTTSSGGPTKVTFDGIIQRERPKGDPAILMVESELGKEDIKYGTLSLKHQLDAVEKGELKLIKLYNPEERPFLNFGKVAGNTRIEYVIVKNVESKPIITEQISKRLRHDLEFDYAYGIKQARIRQEQVGNVIRHWYEGDTLVMPMAIRAMGRDVAKKLDDVRILIKDNKLDEAKELTNRTLPVEWDELHSWFKYDVTTEGLPIPPRLSTTEPIQLVGKHQYIGKMDNTLKDRYTGDKREFFDGTRSGPNAEHNFNPARPDDFNARTIVNEGVKGNPIYKLEPAQTVDVIPSMERSLSRMIRTTFMDDYKKAAVQEWLESAKMHLKLDHPNDVRRSPEWHFEHAEFLPGTDAKLVSQMEVQKFQIKQLLGIPSETEAKLSSIAQDLSDSIYNTFGPKAVQLSPAWLLPKLSDPTSFLRSITFHATLGLFNIPQLLVQMNTFVTIAGIAGPQHAASGTKAALLHLYASYANPKILDKLDELASKSFIGAQRWRVGEFKEAYEVGRRTGFFNVGSEYALDVYNPKVITTTAGAFLDSGTMFFKGGEKSARAGAWYTAFREFRDANPTGRLTQADIKQILNRADLLNVNMSRASNSLLHTGIMAVPSQFLSYQIRLFELMLGKRITDGEKLRLFATYSAVYGIPSAMGLSGFPFADFMRKSAAENGYVVGEKWWDTMITEGVPSMISGLTTGKYLNVGERYGSSGFEPIREALRSDQSWLKIVGGAAFGKLGSVFSHYDPFLGAFQSALRGDGKFKVKGNDLLDVLSEVSSVNNARRAYMAFNTGNWMSKNGTVLDKEITPAMAAALMVTGLQPQGAPDAFVKIWSLKDMQKAHDQGMKLFTKEFHKAVESGKDNPTQSLEYMNRAYSYLRTYGVPQKDWHKALAMAVDGNESLVDKIDWKFYIDKAPDEEVIPRRRAFQTLQRLKKENK